MNTAALWYLCVGGKCRGSVIIAPWILNAVFCLFEIWALIQPSVELQLVWRRKSCLTTNLKWSQILVSYHINSRTVHTVCLCVRTMLKTCHEISGLRFKPAECKRFEEFCKKLWQRSTIEDNGKGFCKVSEKPLHQKKKLRSHGAIPQISQVK